MDYGQNYAHPAKAAVPVQSLVADASRLVHRLEELSGRMLLVSDKLYGSEPRDAAQANGDPRVEPAQPLRRLLDRLGQEISNLDSNLARIEGAL